LEKWLLGGLSVGGGVDLEELSVVDEAGESDEEEDEDDKVLSPGVGNERGSLIMGRISSFSGSAGAPRGRPMMERHSSYADPNRKLGTIKERLSEDARRAAKAEEKSVTTDEQLSRFFRSYARVIDGFEDNEPLLTPVQFSSILRLVTGEKGNLFSEMKTFNK
jgi:hypothetical protein